MRTRYRSPQSRHRRGATAVEMAIVAPLFFLFTFALVEFSRISMVKQGLTDATRAGCREAILATTLNRKDAESKVRDHLRAVLLNDAMADRCHVSISPGDLSSVERGTEITTSVEVNCSDISWIAPRFGDDVMLRAKSTMKRE
ncbi:TadE/TadG family type IV pilus assembly protein [Novipirellula artificiosorum]|uniref:TadE-like protein n=1 Tax=Novipirellula artificiosorum TaxID=2528016 RepID=A0A5C6D7B8_9BACT|nr:TadE family protein [Novipirellula artificiosorum]TWU31734.1 TadE-like protein [Novipirellula artificiosorum]